MPLVFQKWSSMGVVAIFVVDTNSWEHLLGVPICSGYLRKTLSASNRVCLIRPVCGSPSLLLTYCLYHILLWSKHNFPIGGSLRLIRTHWGQQFSLPLLRCKSWQTTDITELFSPKREQRKWASLAHRPCTFLFYRNQCKSHFSMLGPRRRCCEFGVP